MKVLEIAPPWVQTDLLGSNNEPRAMPLAEFIDETMRVLGHRRGGSAGGTRRSRSGITPARTRPHS